MDPIPCAVATNTGAATNEAGRSADLTAEQVQSILRYSTIRLTFHRYEHPFEEYPDALTSALACHGPVSPRPERTPWSGVLTRGCS